MTVDPRKALLGALTDYLGPIDDLRATTHDWASATFVGMRHEMQFTVAWADRRALLVSALPDIDLPMLGHFVADLRLIVTERRTDRLYVEVEVLTIEDA